MSALVVGENVLASLGRQMRRHQLAGTAFVISDANVHRLYGTALRQAVEEAGYRVCEYQVPPGESSKCIEQAWNIYGWLIDQRAERQDTIVTLGGGVVGDLAGFVAATYLRGLALVQVPTSLLAQVDSSVGGKVAINHPKGKNLIGAFHQPRLVLVDTALLASLPPRELRSGWAEVVKTAFILDRELVSFLEGHVESLCQAEPRLTARAVERCLQLKTTVVAADEREQGQRVILNYGHTFAHGLEAATGYERFLHGEAVAIGMVGAALLSQRLGLLPEEVAWRQRSLLQRFGLPLRAPGVDPAAVLKAMSVDKKARDKALRWVLLRDVQDVRVVSDVFPGLVHEVLDALVREETSDGSQAG